MESQPDNGTGGQEEGDSSMVEILLQVDSWVDYSFSDCVDDWKTLAKHPGFKVMFLEKVAVGDTPDDVIEQVVVAYLDHTGEAKEIDVRAAMKERW